MGHAILSPSGASRWLACTPSARLEQGFADRTSEAALEGTAAHALAESLLRLYAGYGSDEDVRQVIGSDEVAPYYCQAMHDYADDYACFVVERFGQAKAFTPDAVLEIEQKLDLTQYVPDGYGTGDAVIIADGTMDIIDLKYGKGVAVYAPDNKQMMLYGLGALEEFGFMYDIDTVRMTIYQPRLDNISEWEMPAADLRAWAETELRPRAELAFKGEGDFAVGEHCRFCRASALCRAQAQKNLELAQYDFKSCELLDDDEVADILSRGDRFTKWLTTVKEFALTQAVDHDKQWPGYKLVEGRSNRVYSDSEKVALTLKDQGYAEDLIYSKELLGITAMEKAITKKVFGALLSDLVVKPQGKPTLVPQTDPREQWNSAASAASDFTDN